MADKQLILPGDIIKKDNELVRTKVRVESVDAGRILANLISCINANDTKFKEIYSVAVKDFISDMGGNSYARIKHVCEQLTQATAEVEEPNPKNPAGSPIFTACPFFTRIQYIDGIVYASFNPIMAAYLLVLKKCFTQYNLLEYLQLPSIYSQRIFEILKSWSGEKEIVISVSKLHEMLNTPNSLKRDFSLLRMRVLDKAYKDINEKTSLRYEWNTIKLGRSVEKIRFMFTNNDKEIHINDTDKKKQLLDLRKGDFEQFWKAYPRQEGIGLAESEWSKLVKLGCLPSIDIIISTLDLFKNSVEWQKQEGRFIPTPAAWLRGKRWLDESIVAICAANTPKEKAKRAQDEARKQEQEHKKSIKIREEKEHDKKIYEDFFAKFSQTPVDSSSKAFRIWHYCKINGNAPRASDVPDKFHGNVIEFLSKWMAEKNISLPKMLRNIMENL